MTPYKLAGAEATTGPEVRGGADIAGTDDKAGSEARDLIVVVGGTTRLAPPCEVTDCVDREILLDCRGRDFAGKKIDPGLCCTNLFGGARRNFVSRSSTNQ